MRCLALLLGISLIAACDAPPPPPGTWADLDASPPDGSLGPPGLSGAVGGGGTGGGGLTTGSPSDCGARVLVVFDRSGSMSAPWAAADGSEQPRWQVASDALVAALRPLTSSIEAGAILFPTGPRLDRDVCAQVAPIEEQLPFRPGDAFLDAWEAIWESGALGLSTPLDPAFARAEEALTFDDVVTAVVLLTDGMPTCSESISAWNRAAAWHARGVDTYVVGLPGAHGEEILDRIAIAGGTGAALPVDDPGTLTEALSAIARDAVEQACL